MFLKILFVCFGRVHFKLDYNFFKRIFQRNMVLSQEAKIKFNNNNSLMQQFMKNQGLLDGLFCIFILGVTTAL